MASYGIIYEFRFDDINGDDVDIFIAKKNYTGSVTRRAMGRAPILKRERNGNILGTSLEIYAECKVDGEFAQLYTSSADEFRVEVYKAQTLLWRGFISPELYSEPDIAPPYDVQIIATDGLGELKDHDYRLYGKASLRSHLQHALAATSLQCDINLISSLSWDDDASSNDPASLLELVTDLSHMAEESCYDVLQGILTSLNACITQQDGSWMVIRESDLYLRAPNMPKVLFGSMAKAQWWPVGNMSIDIMPAKREVSVIHENQYRESILPQISMGVAAGWEIGAGCYYSTAEGGWIIPPEVGLSYRLDSRQYPLQFDMLLRIKARCLAKEGETAASKLSVYMEREYDGTTSYLIRDYSPEEDRVIMRWHNEMMGYVYAWEAPFPEQDTEPTVHDLEVLVPLNSETLAESLNIVIGNPYPSPYLLCIYSIELVQAEQTPGSKLTATITNGARERLSESELVLASSANPSLPELQYGILRGDGAIIGWNTPATSAPDLLHFVARDLAMQVALPRMRYRGKLNVPSLETPRIPMLFVRDNTYYFLNTYSYDLLNSELEVELISVPNASVTIESEVVTQLPSAGSSSGSGSGTSGGGTPGGGGSEGGSDIVVDTEMSDTSTNPVQNKVVKKYIDDEVVYLEGYAEEMANNAEANAKKYTDGKVRELYWADESIGETLTEEQKAYNAEIYRMFAEGLTPIVVLAGIVGSAVWYEDEELGARVELLFRQEWGDSLALLELYLREDGSVETGAWFFTPKVLNLKLPYDAQTFIEYWGYIAELKGIIISLDGGFSEVDVVGYNGRHYVEYNLHDKRYRVEFNADYTINKTIDITPAGGGGSDDDITPSHSSYPVYVAVGLAALTEAQKESNKKINWPWGAGIPYIQYIYNNGAQELTFQYPIALYGGKVFYSTDWDNGDPNIFIKHIINDDGTVTIDNSSNS